jgi:predicted ATPase
VRVLCAHFNGLLAEILEKVGKADYALALVEEALRLVAETGEGWCEAELHRLKGQVFLAPRRHCLGLESERSSGAEECFRRSIDIARRQSAKSLELRATTSLARLLDKQGKKQEARQMLGEIYGWFTEGFDTADLRDAKALLDALS